MSGSAARSKLSPGLSVEETRAPPGFEVHAGVLVVAAGAQCLLSFHDTPPKMQFFNFRNLDNFKVRF